MHLPSSLQSRNPKLRTLSRSRLPQRPHVRKLAGASLKRLLLRLKMRRLLRKSAKPRRRLIGSKLKMRHVLP